MTKSAAVPPDDRLSFTDQALFFWYRATGENLVMQIMWLYEHPIDIDALRQFHRNIGHGLLGRKIERSPLPFGRHRWVAARGPQLDIDIAEAPRPRSEVTDWADERTQLPIDPEWGPIWHLGVQPLTDGSTAVTLVVSHNIADGVGALLTIADAIKGNIRDFDYSPPNSRTRRRAVAADLGETARGVPESGRALAAGAKLAFRRRREIMGGKGLHSAQIFGEDADRNVPLPAVVVYVDIDSWDTRANALGGNSYSLLAGVAARLAEHVGRRAADGTVTLCFPMSERTPDDTRANVVTIATITVDPTHVSADLSKVRDAIREGRRKARDEPDEAMEVLPLIPFAPKRAAKQGADMNFGFTADLPVACSFLGDIDPAVSGVAGSDAEFVMLRGVDRFVTRRTLEERSGLLTMVAGRVGGRMSISVIAYQVGAENSKSRLRGLARGVLEDFSLIGVVE